MIEFVLLVTFGSILLWGFGDFLIQRSVRKVGDVETLAFIGLIASVMLFPFVVNDLPQLFLPENFFVLLLIGLITFVVGLLSFEAFKKGKLSVVEVILEFELPVTIIVCFFLMAESPSLIQYLLIVPVFIGIILVAFKPYEKFHHLHFFEKGALIAVVAALLLGLTNSFTAFSSRSISPILVVWFARVVIFVVALAYILAKKKSHKSLLDGRKFWLVLILAGVIDTVAWVCYAFAMRGANAGVITAITEIYPVIGLVLGIYVNKEKISRHQILGGIIAVCACVLLGITLL